MKNFKSTLFVVCTIVGLFFFSCSDNEKSDEITVKVTASLKYEKDGEEVIDDGARICIFTAFGDTKSWVFDEKTYKYTLPSGAIYIPDYTFVMRAEGLIEETITLNKDGSYIYVYVPKVDRTKYEKHNLVVNGNTIDLSRVFKQ